MDDLPNNQKSNNIRTAASFCLTVGLDPGKSSIQAATRNGPRGREL
jgi:hypothetical protein